MYDSQRDAVFARDCSSFSDQHCVQWSSTVTREVRQPICDVPTARCPTAVTGRVRQQNYMRQRKTDDTERHKSLRHLHPTSPFFSMQGVKVVTIAAIISKGKTIPFRQFRTNMWCSDSIEINHHFNRVCRKGLPSQSSYFDLYSPQFYDFR